MRQTRRFRRIKLLMVAVLIVLLLSGFTVFLIEHFGSGDYDLVVIGSDPEGVAAAVSAARNGISVLLVDSRDELGGLLTLGWLNTLDMNYDPQGSMLTRGIFLEFFNQVEGISFDVNTARRVLEEMVDGEDNLDLLLGREVTGVQVGKKEVTSIVLDDGKRIRAPRFIDATQDAQIAYMAGADFTLGMEDIGIDRNQTVTLVMELGGVDWEKVVKTLSSTDEPSSYSGAYGTTAWGFLEEMRGYKPLDPEIRSRGLNIGLQNNGNILINAMHIFGVTPLDPVSRQEGMERGKREAEFLVRYMRQHLPGFERAFLAATAPELYVRESRHLLGLYRLTVDDLLEHRDFWDKIALASYPVDMQATSMADWGRVMGNPAVYSIPFRCLVPGELTNLLVVGRSASYDSLAHGSARVVPVGMVAAEAAGAAAALSLEKKVDFHKLSEKPELIAVLQERLINQGANLKDFDVPHSMEGHPLYPVVRELRFWGLVTGRYDNDYRLEQPIELRDISQVVEGYLEQVLKGPCRAHNLSDKRQEAQVDDLLWVLDGISEVDLDTLGVHELLLDYNFYQGRQLLRGETFAFLLEFLEKLR
ncbi:MAG: FAD-dependent oxidoreductase [Bacillota bacterium]|nr:FAD-dependent oxidoreductase [Bacillota bacterium]